MKKYAEMFVVVFVSVAVINRVSFLKNITG